MRLKASTHHALAAAALIVPPIGVLAPLGLAPTFAVLALALVVIDPRLIGHVLPGPRILSALLAQMTIWGALSAIWSIIPSHSLFEAGRFALVSIAGLVTVAAANMLPRAGRALVGQAMVAGVCLGLLTIAVEFGFDFPIHQAFSGATNRVFAVTALDRGAVVTALFCWVAILALTEGRRTLAAGGLFCLVGYALLQLSSLSAIIGLVGGAAAYALARWRPRPLAQVMLAAVLVASAALPLVPATRDTITSLAASAPWLRPSALHRLAIWRFTSERIAEHPAIGWGMDASREIPGGRTDIRDYLHLSQDELPRIPRGAASVMPLHPHNAILELWVELGAPGAALGAAIWAWIVWRAAIWHLGSRGARAAALAAIAAAGPPLLLSFGIWQAWWQSTLWLSAALLIAVALPEETKSDRF